MKVSAKDLLGFPSKSSEAVLALLLCKFQYAVFKINFSTSKEALGVLAKSKKK
jgi:hypothetical protein